jgi:hypothetical protein
MKNLSIDSYNLYAKYLNNRILGSQHLTEDSVRYSFFFAALQTTDINQHELILELPHPKFQGKEIDTYVLPKSARKEIYIEFKFHRASKSSSPKPQKAGSLFKDFSRLSSIKNDNSTCLVIYLTDAEMADYFDKHANTYSNFWEYGTETNFIFDENFVAKTSNTFRKASGDLHATKVKVAFSKSLVNGYYLKVFEVY